MGLHFKNWNIILLQVKNESIQESLNKKSAADVELYDGNDGGDICDDDVCGGDFVDNYGWWWYWWTGDTGSADGSDNHGEYDGDKSDGDDMSTNRI